MKPAIHASELPYISCAELERRMLRWYIREIAEINSSVWKPTAARKDLRAEEPSAEFETAYAQVRKPNKQWWQ